MDLNALVALAAAAFANTSPNERLFLSLNRSLILQTFSSHLKSAVYKAKVLDALAELCSRGKNETVAIGLKIGKPVELILATNEDHPDDTINLHLTTLCSILKRISDQIFSLRLSKADKQTGSPGIDSEDVELEDLHHEFFLEVYKFSYDKLMLKHAKWWSVFEKFRTQSLEWEQERKQDGREQNEVADLVEPYQAAFHNLVQFRKFSIAVQNSLSECCQTEKVGWTRMHLLNTRWQWLIVYANNILNHSSACEYWATKVAKDGPVIPLRRAIEKLVAFHYHVLSLIQFASIPHMRSLFFSTEIRVTSVEKNRPALLKWPSSKPEWMNFLSTIYIKRGIERETGQIAVCSERNLAEKAIKHGRAETVHCECAVIAYLHHYSPSFPAFFYIGVSKSPCKPSYNWMKAYNDTAGTIFRTRGTNDKWYKGWARPGLGQVEFQEKVDARFQEIVENEFCLGQMDLGLARSRSAFDSSD